MHRIVELEFQRLMNFQISRLELVFSTWITIAKSWMAENSEAVDRNMYTGHIYHPPTKLCVGGVMFSVLSVCLAGCSQGEGAHVTITHYALDLTVQFPSPQFPSPSDMGLHCTGTPFPGHRTLLYIESPPSPQPQVPLLVACCGHPWRPIQICLLQDPPTSTDIWW